MSTDTSTRIKFHYSEKIDAWENPDDYEDFCFTSIYTLVFKDENPSRIHDIYIKSNEISDELFIIYQIYSEKKRIIRFDPFSIFGFTLYNEEYNAEE